MPFTAGAVVAAPAAEDAPAALHAATSRSASKAGAVLPARPAVSAPMTAAHARVERLRPSESKGTASQWPRAFAVGAFRGQAGAAPPPPTRTATADARREERLRKGDPHGAHPRAAGTRRARMLAVHRTTGTNRTAA